MKLAQLLEQGHFAVWAQHPGGLGGTSEKSEKTKKHPGVPEHKSWVDSFENKTKEMKQLGTTGREERENKK